MSKRILLAAGILLCVSGASFAADNANIIRMNAPIAGAPKPAAASFALTSQALPDGEVGTAYTFDMNTLVSWSDSTSARPALSWSALGLLSGLSLSSDGIISGTPSAAGSASVQATAASGTTSKSGSFDLSVTQPTGHMCKDILKAAPSSTSGVYAVSFNSTTVNAYCDMTSDGGGWTLVGRGAPSNPGNWDLTAGDQGITTSPSPNSSTSFKFADATINAMPKSAYKVASSGGYNNIRYFKPTCVYNQLAVSTGDCAISYSSTAWDNARGDGSSGGAGLSDNRTSVANDGYYVMSALSATDAKHGWAAGAGTNGSYTATGIAGNIVGETIWVK